MRRRIPPAILSAAAGLVLLWHAGGSGAQSILATGSDADVTEEGLHRVNPAIMKAAWVRPDLDLSRYTRILLMPTAVQFRDLPKRKYDARSRLTVRDFPLSEERKKWLRELWRKDVEAQFAQEKSYELYEGVGADVLVIQGFLVDVVSHIPPANIGSAITLVRDPWTVNVVLELRDTTGKLLARTIDRRQAQGLVNVSEVWYRSEDLVQRWAQVLSERLDQLSELGGRDTSTPPWAR